MSLIQAALYARVSSDQQSQAQTIQSQLKALRTRIAGDDAQLAPDSEFVDDGYSGSTLIRPDLERLRDAVANGSIDRLYVHSPDRLARKYAYQVLLVDEWQRAGIEIVFLNHELGGSPEDELLLQVQGMIAEYERAKILERSRRGKRHKAQVGSVSVLSGAPYGYRYITIGEGGGQARYEICEEEAQVVRQIFTWVGRERLSIGAACRRSRAAGVPTRSGKTWWDRTSCVGHAQKSRLPGPGRLRQDARRCAATATASPTRTPVATTPGQLHPRCPRRRVAPDSGAGSGQ